MKTNIRALSSYDAASLGVDTMGTASARAIARGAKGQTLGGDVNAPAFEVTATYTYQSYFDNTLLQQAILPQPQNEPIIPSTLSDPIQIGGYGLALHPSSESPVSVVFDTGAQQGRSATYALSPGQIVRPFGRPDGVGNPGSFSGFRFGLPFGWLGGGAIKLMLLRTPDAHTLWNGHPEIIFHRTRMKIIAPASVPADPTTLTPTPFYNWPKRFPWTQAIGNQGLRQSGTPVLSVTPTRTSMSLRLNVLAAPADMRVLFFGTQDYGQLSTGATDDTDVRFVDMTWGSYAVSGIVNVNAYPTQIVTGQAERYGADEGGVILVDLSGGSLDDEYVDVVRYGRL